MYSLKYDSFGRRIYKSSSAGTSIHAYDDDGNLVEEGGWAREFFKILAYRSTRGVYHPGLRESF